MNDTKDLDQTTLQLLQLSGLIQSSIADYVAAKQRNNAKSEGSLPSHSLFEAQRTLLSAAGMLTELVSDPSSRIIEVAFQHFEARSLHLAASLRVPEILEEHGETGCGIHELSARVGVEARKLCECKL